MRRPKVWFGDCIEVRGQKNARALVAPCGQTTIFAQSVGLFAAARKEYGQQQNFVTGAGELSTVRQRGKAT
jgi:hypothetical protein